MPAGETVAEPEAAELLVVEFGPLLYGLLTSQVSDLFQLGDGTLRWDTTPPTLLLEGRTPDGGVPLHALPLPAGRRPPVAPNTNGTLMAGTSPAAVLVGTPLTMASLPVERLQTIPELVALTLPSRALWGSFCHGDRVALLVDLVTLVREATDG